MNYETKQDIKFLLILSAIFLFFAALLVNLAPFLSGSFIGLVIAAWFLYLESK